MHLFSWVQALWEAVGYAQNSENQSTEPKAWGAIYIYSMFIYPYAMEIRLKRGRFPTPIYIMVIFSNWPCGLTFFSSGLFTGQIRMFHLPLLLESLSEDSSLLPALLSSSDCAHMALK